MRIDEYIVWLVPPLVGVRAFEIAFNPYNMYTAPGIFFADKPLPEFNWSVYPRYSCNAVNWEGYPLEAKGFVADILFREAPGTPAKIPQIVAFYRADFPGPDQFDPCLPGNIKLIARIGRNADDPVGRIVKLSPWKGNRITHWQEINPRDLQTFEMDVVRQLKLEPWNMAFKVARNRFGATSFNWEIKPGNAENGYMTESYICLFGFNYYERRQGYGSDYNEDEQGYDTESDLDELADELTVYTSDEDVPAGGRSPGRLERVLPAPREIIRDNSRWVYRPTTTCKGLYPAYVNWRNDRIRNAGDYIRYDPNTYLYKQSYETLIGRGNIIDVELDKQQQEEFKRQQAGVRAAELFYETMAGEVNPPRSWIKRNPALDEIWLWDNPEKMEYAPADPLQALLDVESNNIPEEDLNYVMQPKVSRERLPGIPPKFRDVGEPAPARQPAEEPAEEPFGPRRWAPKNTMHDIFSGPPSPDMDTK
ncbi:hypothetical protein TWF481_009762 [Arthrobotrys musiformis]|uniref:Uncharacterized protein n=1 Tax=Arthrobotrys musiformis TaxID=47236 RepID=A0AAV9W4S3_9PEZI